MRNGYNIDTLRSVDIQEIVNKVEKNMRVALTENVLKLIRLD